MAKKQSDSVYRIVDVVGVSKESWEDAGRRAVETAAGSLRDLRVAEVTKMYMRWRTERSWHFERASHSRSSTRPDLLDVRFGSLAAAARQIVMSALPPEAAAAGANQRVRFEAKKRTHALQQIWRVQ
jgi:dodecin